jgi:type IV pilus assembly protein PilM
MAKSGAVWGIDIGQCALKALRCRPHERDERRLVVEAFDYIEYSKILTQPEANREELVRNALQEFASRNDVTGDAVAIAVPGQSGLARFIKLPPVESKKIPDIVKYEARQQIPFALEDVVWDYQQLVGSEDEGYALETEVGLFAMKRDQVARALRPLDEVAIDVDIIQLAPLSIYNFICFDRLTLEGPYDPSNPPPSTVVISIGTDTTDLVITNGYRVWQRNIPIGGNHFTKALTKELKLTFAKAEHLKRNAMKAENPKAVFQAMRPVFSDLVAEIQRSIGFFTSNNRNAKLGTIVALGNPMKLPGLQRFLSQNLDQEVQLVDNFNGLVGGTATASPQYKENQLTFGVAYGLCVQALGEGQIQTNLLPDELVTTRLVRAKKPWAVAAVAVLLLALTVNYARQYSAWTTADVNDQAMKDAIALNKGLQQTVNTQDAAHTGFVTEFEKFTKIAQNLQSNTDGRMLWLELLKAIHAALPQDTRPPDQRKQSREDVAMRPELHIERIDLEPVGDLALWFSEVQPLFEKAEPPAAAPAAAPGPQAEGAPADASTAAANPADPSQAAATGPSGAGYVIQMEGYHLHNSLPDPGAAPLKASDGGEGREFVLNTLCRNLQLGGVELPDGENGALVSVPISSLGISHPVIITTFRVEEASYYATPMDAGATPGRGRAAFSGREEPGAIGAAAGPAEPEIWNFRRYRFIVQFCWKPTPRSVRKGTLAGQGGPVSSTASLPQNNP